MTFKTFLSPVKGKFKTLPREKKKNRENVQHDTTVLILAAIFVLVFR